MVVKHQENFPRKELHASHTAMAGAEAAVNTANMSLGVQGYPQSMAVFWGGNRLHLTPKVPSQQKRGTGTAGEVVTISLERSVRSG